MQVPTGQGLLVPGLPDYSGKEPQNLRPESGQGPPEPLVLQCLAITLNEDRNVRLGRWKGELIPQQNGGSHSNVLNCAPRFVQASPQPLYRKGSLGMRCSIRTSFI